MLQRQSLFYYQLWDDCEMQASNIKEVDQTTTTRLGHSSLLVHPFDSINSTSRKSDGRYFKRQGL